MPRLKLTCPFSKVDIIDPVILNGYIYERSAIEAARAQKLLPSSVKNLENDYYTVALLEYVEHNGPIIHLNQLDELYKCPLTLSYPVRPVLCLKDGRTYDLPEILQAFKADPRSPMTRKKLDRKDFVWHPLALHIQQKINEARANGSLKLDLQQAVTDFQQTRTCQVQEFKATSALYKPSKVIAMGSTALFTLCFLPLVMSYFIGLGISSLIAMPAALTALAIIGVAQWQLFSKAIPNVMIEILEYNGLHNSPISASMLTAIIIVAAFIAADVELALTLIFDDIGLVLLSANGILHTAVFFFVAVPANLFLLHTFHFAKQFDNPAAAAINYIKSLFYVNSARNFGKTQSQCIFHGLISLLVLGLATALVIATSMVALSLSPVDPLSQLATIVTLPFALLSAYKAIDEWLRAAFSNEIELRIPMHGYDKLKYWAGYSLRIAAACIVGVAEYQFGRFYAAGKALRMYSQYRFNEYLTQTDTRKLTCLTTAKGLRFFPVAADDAVLPTVAEERVLVAVPAL